MPRQQNQPAVAPNAGTNPQKVKQEIEQDVRAGVGSMTSREAGAMHDGDEQR